MINALQKEELVDSAELEKAKEKLSALLAQPPGEFYSHHSLEAADALESSLSEAAGNLGSHLQAAAQTAGSLEKNVIPPSLLRTASNWRGISGPRWRASGMRPWGSVNHCRSSSAN